MCRIMELVVKVTSEHACHMKRRLNYLRSPSSELWKLGLKWHFYITQSQFSQYELPVFE